MRDKGNRRQPLLYYEAKECCGCSACEAVCPQNAITMVSDDILFPYPDIDKDRCVSCLLCEKVCPLKNKESYPCEKHATRAFAVRHLSGDVVAQSSSGGVFTLLSDFAFENHWGIACCVYNFESNQTEYKIITSKKERDEARGSKYIHSHMDSVFRKCLQYINSRQIEKLLFVGLGCQTEGFRKYCVVHHVEDKVVLCDLICHGQASELFWKNQLSMLDLENVKLEKLTFKDKKKGWENPSAYVQSNGGKRSIKYYNNLFYGGYIMRPSCYACHFTTTDRHSDLTIGDFWGIQNHYPHLYDKMGVSLVLVHSVTGEKLLNSIKSKASITEVEVSKCIQPRLKSPLEKPPRYDEFWNDVRQKGVKKTMIQYGKDSIADKYSGGYRKSSISQNGFCEDRRMYGSKLSSAACA